MAIERESDHFRITLNWCASTKRWKMIWKVRVGRGWAHHWLWIDTDAPIDALAARDLANALKRQLEARLF